MELDSLKEIWNDAGKVPVQQNNNEQIKEMLNKSSKSPVAKMKRNLVWELITVVVLFSITAMYYFIAFSGKYALVAWMYIVLMLVFGFYFYIKTKLLNEMLCVTCMVKASLEKQVHTLERYVRLYLWAGTLMFPLVIIYLSLVLYNKLPGIYNNKSFFPVSMDTFFKSGLFGVLLITAITAVLYFLNKWYIYKLYGRHIKKLKAVVKEMNDE